MAARVEVPNDKMFTGVRWYNGTAAEAFPRLLVASGTQVAPPPQFGGVREVGAHELVWDGTDDGGRRVESGVYFVRAEAGGGVQTRKVALFK